MDLDALRHSAAHLLASAVKELYPKAKFAIGPSIEDGFYYDFDNLNVNEEDLAKIEKRMHEIANKKLDFKKVLMPRKKALEFLKDQPYKLELLRDISGEKVQFFQHGDYYDMCKGGHLNNTKDIKAFKLLKVTKAYWRGDSGNKQLTRIYGTAWNSEEDLKDYVKRLEEAEKRDHRKLGKDLDLFFFHEYSPGAPIFLPNGVIVYNELLKFLREEYQKRNYMEVITPLLYEKKLWETSGHWEHYKENMFNMESEKKTYSLKPMNCPSHCLIYKNKLYSYKDLPIKIADFAPLHRNEISGALSGLTRVRKFAQDDSHIFVTEEQLESEIENLLEFEKHVYNDVFKFNYIMTLGTRPEKFIGDKKLWDKAEKILQNILKKKKIPFTVIEKDGAFYGPKIDLRVKDALNREWQLATIQIDFQLPLRFDLTYEGKDGKKHTPIMVHRAILGSIERFMALLLEHYAGKFPLWLSPVQVLVMNINENNSKFAKEVYNELKKNNVRVELDDRNESIPRKVREAQLRKIPYSITIGDKEQQNKSLAIRTLDGKLEFNVKVNDFVDKINKKIMEKE